MRVFSHIPDFSRESRRAAAGQALQKTLKKPLYALEKSLFSTDFEIWDFT